MKMPVNPANTKCLKAGNYTFEKVSEYKYPDTLNNSLNTESRYKLQVANGCYHGLRKQQTFHCTRINTILTIYKRPVLLYGCETCATDTSDENKIIIFETKDLRDVYDPIKLNGEWRRRYSDKL
jgi:hypothetical protein